ncbi:Hsp20/alpha crystallin family protein [Niallia sp. JL1B1071]|uniref:Hsp20/alpha crystallin family protein n=1 Tax=Niallia tiangongensis TaxID=3237105 RepID=UPI0037DC863F
MSSNFPIDPNKKEKSPQVLNGFMRSMNQFFQEKPVKNFLQQMDEFFSNPFPNMAFSVSVNETESATIIKAELPGINKEQIQLDIFDYHLTISVHHQEIITEENAKAKTFHTSQTFKKSSRSITFPHPIDEKKVKASYQNGLLTIKVPKQKGTKIMIEDQSS